MTFYNSNLNDIPVIMIPVGRIKKCIWKIKKITLGDLNL